MTSPVLRVPDPLRRALLTAMPSTATADGDVTDR